MNKPETIYLKNYKQSQYLINFVDLTVFIQSENRVNVKSKLEIFRNPQLDETPNILKLYGVNLILNSIKIDGVELNKSDYETDNNSINWIW